MGDGLDAVGGDGEESIAEPATLSATTFAGSTFLFFFLPKTPKNPRMAEEGTKLWALQRPFGTKSLPLTR